MDGHSEKNAEAYEYRAVRRDREGNITGFAPTEKISSGEAYSFDSPEERFASVRDPNKILYHYTGVPALQGIVTNKEVWASHIRYMNDKKEFSHSLDQMLGIVHANKKSVNEDLFRHLTKAFGQREDNLFVFSLSEEPDLLSQWRAYCPKGGVSIGFDVSALKLLSKKENLKLVRCEYNHKRQIEIVKDHIHKAINRFEKHLQTGKPSEEAGNLAATETRKDFSLVAASMKHSSFSEEKEWRLIGRANEKDQRAGWLPASSMLIPYMRLRAYPKTPCVILNLIQDLPARSW